MGKDHEAMLDRACEARASFWREWGELDPDLLVPLINPGLRGLPSWPALRQAYRVARRGSLTLVTTDGLSDPFADPELAEEQGFGLEFYIVTKDSMPSPLQGAWPIEVLNQLGLNAADHGGFQEVIRRFGLLSMQLYDAQLPEEWLAPDGTVGVLLNLQDDSGAGVPGEIEMPIATSLMVNVKVLTPAELEFCASGGAEARAELAERFKKQGRT